MYPLSTVYEKIVHSGFFNNEFEQYWGLDPKQVQAQVGNVMAQAKGQYDQTVYDKIKNRSLDRGISPDEAAGTFSTKLGYASAFRKDHAPKVQKEMDLAFEQFIDQSLKDLQKQIGVKDDKGWITSDPSKKDTKQSVNFDFWNNIYNDTYDESGVLTNRQFDVIGNYAKAWINSAPNAKEKAARQSKVNAIYNKDYSAVGKKAYDESLNAPLSGYMGDPFEGLSNQQITNTYGDRMQTLRSNQYKVFNDKATFNALGARQQAIKSKQDADLANATGFNNDFAIFMENSNRQGIYNTFKDALKSGDITAEDKAKVLGSLKNKNVQQALNTLLGKSDILAGSDVVNSVFRPTYQDRLSSLSSFDSYINKLDHNSKHSISAGTPTQEIGLGTKIWDVVTNPGDAIYYGMNGRGESMWGTSNKSYNERKELERTLGVDAGTYKDMGVTSVINMFNSFNPANWVDELNRGYQANGMTGLGARSSDLAWDAAMTAATFVPGGQTLRLANEAAHLAKTAEAINAIKNTGTLLNRTVNTGRGLFNTGMRTLNTIERGVNSLGLPGKILVNSFKTSVPAFAWDAVRPGGDFNQSYNNFSEGNIGEGFEKLAYGTLGVLPMLSRVPLSYQTPGGKTFGLGNVGSQFEQGLQYAPNAKTFKQVISPSLKKDYYALSQQIHPDKFSQFGQTAERAASAQMQNLKDIYSGEQFMSIPFNQNLQIGRMQPKYSFNMGRLGQLNYGQNVFKPMSLQEMVTGTPKVVTTSPPAPVLLPESAVAPQTEGTKKLTGLFKGRRIRIRQTGGSAGNPIIDSLRQLGYQKQYGGLSTELSDSEIEMYVKGGYIIEDE